MTIRCVVSCRDANGTPTFYPCSIECSQDEYDNGEHYCLARRAAEEARYEDARMVHDENDGPAWLFTQLFKGA